MTSRVQIIVSSFLSDKKVFGDNKKIVWLGIGTCPAERSRQSFRVFNFFCSAFLFPKKNEQPIRMPKISNFFVCFSVICGMARGARKQNGVWREFLDFEECEREGLMSDYGRLDFVTCAEDGGISRCYLQIECTDHDKRYKYSKINLLQPVLGLLTKTSSS